MTTVVKNPTGDFFNNWNPNGTAFVYGSEVNDSITDFYKNNRLFIYDLKAKTSLEIAQNIDETKSVVDWNKSGLFISALDKTKRKLFRVDVQTGHSSQETIALDLPAGISFSGPTGIDLADPVPGTVYPIMQWVEKGALVLRVNYRGSAGYGEKFRSLNVGN